MHGVILCLAGAVVTAEAPRPAAMVLTTKGKVALIRDAEPAQPLGAMAILRVGDRVQVVPDGEASVVFLGDGHRERIKPGSTVAVSADGCAPATAAERLAAPKLAPQSLAGLRSLSQSGRGAVGILRSPDFKPPAVTPIYGATILSDRPALSWPALPGVDGYYVELLSGVEGRDQRVLWKVTTKETQLVYPKEKPLVFGNRYFWQVRPLKGEDRGDPFVHSKVLVITEEELETLKDVHSLRESKDTGDLLLAATTYEAYGAYDEALRLYKRLAQLSPHESHLFAALGSYYERAGKPKEAAAAREKAKQSNK